MPLFRKDWFRLEIGRKDTEDTKRVTALQLQSTPQGVLIIAPLASDEWDLGALFTWGCWGHVDLAPIHDGGPLEAVLRFRLDWEKCIWMPFDLNQIGTKSKE